MMTKYYFIPLLHEAILAFAIQYWKEQGGWVVVQGIYQDGAFLKGDSAVFAIDRSGKEVSIKKSVTDFEGITKTIIGFCLKGNVQELAPKSYEQLMQSEGVKEFDTPQKYLDYIKTL